MNGTVPDQMKLVRRFRRPARLMAISRKGAWKKVGSGLSDEHIAGPFVVLIPIIGNGKSTSHAVA
jgi:hypothetical protein